MLEESAHVVIFGVLTYLVVRSMADLDALGDPLVLGVVGALGYGLLLELAQIQVPGRGFEWLDLVMNGIGVVLGVVLARRRGHV